MDVREKLVELIEQSGACFECFPVGDYEQKQIEKIASNLIANGVTVQELDGCEYCNAFTEDDINGFFLPTTDPECECAMVTIKFCPMCGRRLPQPPKGE